MWIIVLVTLTLCLFSSFTTMEMIGPATNFRKTNGHYPASYCQFSDVLLSFTERSFLYQSETAHHVDCYGVADIWPIRNMPNMSLNCDEEYDNGHIFTIYYWFGGSNYFHLHYDMLIPLYLAVHYEQKSDSNPRKHIFMPTVESRRLQALDWNTKAFDDHSKYWIQMSQIISIPYIYLPMDESFLNRRKNICFKNVNFGTPSVKHDDAKLIQDFVRHIQKMVNVTKTPFEIDRIGVISRSNRRRILNENELIATLNSVALTEKVEFTGMTFYEQVLLMQRFSVLVGVNGAGMTNGLYLPPYGVAVQIVPFEAKVNFREFGKMLKARGPYLEWHNTHKNLTHIPQGDQYNNNADTEVHIKEFKTVIYEALLLSQKSRHALKMTHQEL